MEQTKAKATKFCLIAGILFLILRLYNGWTIFDNQDFYQEQIEYYQEKIDNWSPWYNWYDWDDFHYYNDQLIEYEQLADWGIWNVQRVRMLLPTVGFLLAAILLLTRRQGALLAVGFLPLLVEWVLLLFDYIQSGVPLRSWFIGLLGILTYLLLFIFSLRREKSRKVWFLPTICCALTVVINAFGRLPMLRAGMAGQVFLWTFWELVEVAAVTTAGLWIAFPRQRTPEERQAQTGTNSGAGTVYRTDIYYGLVQHCLLLLFTLGIWQLIWIYRTTVTLNDLEDEPPRNPVTKLLLCMFIPFYAIYWFYRSAQRVDRMARGKGIPSELSGTCLLLAFFVPFAPPVLIQEKINTLAQWNGGEMPRLAPQNMSDALRELKQLLDDGVLTQEEFNAKKQQILNL